MSPQQKLEGLRSLQIEERRYVESIERNGATGRAVNYLRSRIEARELEIKALQASVLEEAGALRHRSVRQIDEQSDAA
jgi:hypothetical protein